jgi:hypothetical protein
VRLSELIARCAGHHDPIIAVEGPDGVPHDITDVDLGVVVHDIGSSTYVLLLTEEGRQP